MKPRLWLDIANSPHALFFGPIIEILRAEGVEVALSSREFGDTVRIARMMGLEAAVMGRHAGRGLLRKSVNLLRHAAQLARWARNRGFSLAASHNSYSQALAARMAGVPFITFMDYEGQPANRIAFSLARLVVLPEAFPEDVARKQGARRLYRYRGFKEEVYLAHYEPGPSPYEDMGLDTAKPVVLVRGPATYAAYHGRENRLFAEMLRYLAARDASGVVLARTEEQRALARSLGMTVPKRAYYGPDLVWHADLVIGAGGTMTREAALLGVPVWTIFAGKLGAVDRALMEQGLLVDMRDRDPSHLLLRKKTATSPRPLNRGLAHELAGVLLEEITSL